MIRYGKLLKSSLLLNHGCIQNYAGDEEGEDEDMDDADDESDGGLAE
jgi:hypothetical protein